MQRYDRYGRPIPGRDDETERAVKVVAYPVVAFLWMGPIIVVGGILWQLATG
jgi:hypothetical protein